MTFQRVLSRAFTLVFAVAILSVARPAWAQGPQVFYALVRGTNTLVSFDPANPANLLATTPLTGLFAGDVMRAIDFRPANGQLYGIATLSANLAQVRLYIINRQTGATTAVGPPATVSLAGTFWGMSFNPTVDRIRIVNDFNANARLNPDTGGLAGSDINLTAIVDSVAYTNQFPGATTTTLYCLNLSTNRLAVIGGANGLPSPNGGVVTDIGPLGFAFNQSGTALDFDANGTLYAIARPNGGNYSLYRIDIGTGVATLIGTVGPGTLLIDSVAAPPAILGISPPSGTYTSRQSFDLVLLLNAPGRAIVAGSAQFNNLNALPYLASCVVFGTASNGIVSLRCPNFGGPLVGSGIHTMTVNLVLSNGETVSGSATWTILATSEP